MLSILGLIQTLNYKRHFIWIAKKHTLGETDSRNDSEIEYIAVSRNILNNVRKINSICMVD